MGEWPIIIIYILILFSLYDFNNEMLFKLPITMMDNNLIGEFENVMEYHSKNSYVENIQKPIKSSFIDKASVSNDIIHKADRLIDKNWAEYAGNNVTEGYFRLPGYEGLLDLYVATHDEKYLNVALDMADKYVSSGNDKNSDGFLDWYSPLTPKIGNINHWHYEWRAAVGIARLVGFVSSRPELQKFKKRNDALVSFIEMHVWDKWDPSGRLSHISSRDTNVTTMLGRLGSIAIGLYKATNDIKYQQYVIAKGREILNSFEYDSAKNAYNLFCYTNGDDCDSNIPGTIDVSHAGDAVRFILYAYEEKYEFLEEIHIQRLINTMKKVIWIDPVYINDWVNGLGPSTGIGRNNSGWVKLTRYDDTLACKYIDWALSKSPSGLSSFERVGTLGALARVLVEDNRNINCHR